MTRFQRLCLDAVERCGTPYAATATVQDYVRRRRWFGPSISGALMALQQLEQLGYLTGTTVPRTPTNPYERRVYKRTAKLDPLETVEYNIPIRLGKA